MTKGAWEACAPGLCALFSDEFHRFLNKEWDDLICYFCSYFLLVSLHFYCVCAHVCPCVHSWWFRSGGQRVVFSSLLVLSTLWIRGLSTRSHVLAASTTSLAHNHFKNPIRLKVHNLCVVHLSVCILSNFFLAYLSWLVQPSNHSLVFQICRCYFITIHKLLNIYS